MAKKFLALVLLALGLLALGGCGGSNSSGPYQPPDQTWTLLVYLDADNALEPYGAMNLRQMIMAGDNPHVRVLVLWDGKTGKYGFPAGSRVYRLVHGGFYQLADWGELDMGDPQNLVDFVAYASERFPADHYGVVLWNYGGGWRREGEKPRYGKTFNTSRNVCWDDSSGHSITLPELKTSFAEISSQLGQPVDLAGFDASLMGMMEVAYELKDSCLIMASSEESEPEQGWPYYQILRAIYQDPNAAAADLGEFICNAYLNAYPAGSGVTFSVLDLARADEALAALNNFSLKLQTIDPSQTYLGQLALQAYRFSDPDFIDLRDFSRIIMDDEGISNLELKDAAQAVFEVLTQGADRFILARGYKDKTKALSDTGGVSIYYPSPAWGSSYDPNYNQLDMSKDTYWPESPQIQEHVGWIKSWGGPLNEKSAYGLEVQGDEIYCLGGTNTFGAGMNDLFILKYDEHGSLLWQKTWGGPQDEYSFSDACSDNANLCLVGDTNSFGAGGFDLAFLRYAPDGELLWQKTWGGALNDWPNSISRDASGNFYISGNTFSFGVGGQDIFLLKCDNQGNLLWQKTWGGPRTDYGCSVIAAASGAYILGFTNSFNAANVTALLKFDTQGNLLWQRTWEGGLMNGTQNSWQDGEGNLYLTGWYRYEGTNDDILTMKFDSQGNLLWAKTWGGSDMDRALIVNGDQQGRIVVSGFCHSIQPGEENLALLEYDTDGHLLRQRVWQSNSAGCALAFDRTGSLLVSGQVANAFQGGWQETFFPDRVPTGTLVTPAGTVTTPAAPFSVPAGIETTPAGSETYAGGQDYLLLKLGR